MNKDRSKKIKGKGWNGFAVELKEKENFDLLNLVKMDKYSPFPQPTSIIFLSSSSYLDMNFLN